jgi:hypothetical protein
MAERSPLRVCTLVSARWQVGSTGWQLDSGLLQVESTRF